MSMIWLLLTALDCRMRALCVLCMKKVLKCYTVSCVVLVSIIVDADMIRYRSP